ncbi:hypothetical protein AAC03nite_27800 [Alicyclobacillus acidoterrestris]|nr:hypothetical protein AAC03nite_27800 [Alicyclobacillus acidoterrestris]
MTFEMTKTGRIPTEKSTLHTRMGNRIQIPQSKGHHVLCLKGTEGHLLVGRLAGEGMAPFCLGGGCVGQWMSDSDALGTGAS